MKIYKRVTDDANWSKLASLDKKTWHFSYFQFFFNVFIALKGHSS